MLIYVNCYYRHIAHFLTVVFIYRSTESQQNRPALSDFLNEVSDDVRKRYSRMTVKRAKKSAQTEFYRALNIALVSLQYGMVRGKKREDRFRCVELFFDSMMNPRLIRALFNNENGTTKPEPKKEPTDLPNEVQWNENKEPADRSSAN